MFPRVQLPDGRIFDTLAPIPAIALRRFKFHGFNPGDRVSVMVNPHGDVYLLKRNGVIAEINLKRGADFEFAPAE